MNEWAHACCSTPSVGSDEMPPGTSVAVHPNRSTCQMGKLPNEEGGIDPMMAAAATYRVCADRSVVRGARLEHRALAQAGVADVAELPVDEDVLRMR